MATAANRWRTAVRWTPEHGEAAAEAYRKSGLSLQAFAVKNRVPMQKLHRWLPRSMAAKQSPDGQYFQMATRANSSLTKLARWGYQPDHPLVSATVGKVASILRDSEQGRLDRLMDLYDDMRERDPHLAGVCDTRVGSMTAREWPIVPADESPEARAAADLCSAVVRQIPMFQVALRQLAEATCLGLAVLEQEWDDATILMDAKPIDVIAPIALHWLHAGRFGYTSQMQLVVCDEGSGVTYDPEQGKPLDSWGPDRFVVHQPVTSGTYPTRRGALRGCIFSCLVKRYGLRWWTVALERFGTPALAARVPQGSENLIPAAEDFLKALATNFQGVLVGNIDVVELPGTGTFEGRAHDLICSYIDRQHSKLVLGQTMTTDDGSSLSQAQVHEEVRHDKLVSDCNELAEALRMQLLTPIIRRNRAEWLSVVPYFAPDLRPRDAVIADWHYINGIVTRDEVRERLGLGPWEETATDSDGESSAEQTAKPAETGSETDAPAERPQLSDRFVGETRDADPIRLAPIPPIVDDPSTRGERIADAPDYLAQETAKLLFPVAAAWVADLATRLRQAGLGGYKAVIAPWIETIQKDDAFADLLWQQNIQADLGGRLLVAGPELGKEALYDYRSKALALADRTFRFDAIDDFVQFFRMPFPEAVEFFQEKRLVSAEQFDALTMRYKDGVFVARLLATENLQERARRVLQRSFDEQATIADTIAALERNVGLVPEHPGYLLTVARTNVANAYGAGRWDQMTSGPVRRLRPFVQYMAVTDSRTRPNHGLLHLKVFENGSDLAAQYAPPLGFECRCIMRTLSVRQMQAEGLRPTDKPVVDAYGRVYLGDPGWQHAPAPLTRMPRA